LVNWHKFILATIVSVLWSCGIEPVQIEMRQSKRFTDQADSLDATAAANVLWVDNCSSKAEITKDTLTEVSVFGTGAVQLDFVPDFGFQFDIGMEPCDAELRRPQRDVLIGIDTSESMATVDPFDGESCGRMKAVENAFAPGGLSSADRVSVMVFSDGVPFKVPGFFEDVSELLSRLENAAFEQTAAEIICGARGDKNSISLLQSAVWIHTNFARTYAAKKLVVISDSYDFDDQQLDRDQLDQGGIEIAEVIISDQEHDSENESASGNSETWQLELRVDDMAEAFYELFAQSLFATLDYRLIKRPEDPWKTLWKSPEVTEVPSEGLVPSEKNRFFVKDIQGVWGVEWRWLLSDQHSNVLQKRRGGLSW
jgi:hypothetical protein